MQVEKWKKGKQVWQHLILTFRTLGNNRYPLHPPDALSHNLKLVNFLRYDWQPFFILCKLVSLEAALGEGAGVQERAVGCCLSVWHRMDALWRLRFPTAALIKRHAGIEWASVCREVLVCVFASECCEAGSLLRITGPHSCGAGAISTDCSLEWAHWCDVARLNACYSCCR